MESVTFHPQNDIDYYGVRFKFTDDHAANIYENEPPKYETDGSVGFDLKIVENVRVIGSGQFILFKLGLIARPPDGYHIELLPRSSTFRKFGIIMPNSIGLIDEDYCGPEDELLWPGYVVDHTLFRGNIIKEGTRLCQGVLRKTYKPDLILSEWSAVSRGGHGSTGI